MNTISENLKKKTNDVVRLIHKDGYKEEYADALFKYGTYVYDEEKDKESGIKILNLAKDAYEHVIENATHGTWYDLDKYCKKNGVTFDLIDRYYEILRWLAQRDFECFLIYMEKNRQPEKRFYMPRRNTLYVVAHDLQDLEDRKYDFYGLSLPPRIGKSTICIFFLAWICGKRRASHNAMSGHSGILAERFYDDVFKLTQDEEYTFGEIFPTVRLYDKSAEKMELRFNKIDAFATLTCRGIDGTWTGAVDISSDGYLYVDDLVRDRAESLSPKRLESRYQDYLNVLVDRKNDGSRELMVGTRWNVSDPLGRIESDKADNPRYFFRKIPALDENDHSNFVYEFGIGFSDEYYKEIRDRLDRNEWQAKYQQEPFVREGLLLPENELQRFSKLPEGEYSTIALCDPALGGNDSLSMPICKYKAGDKKKYIIDWVFTKATTKASVPKVVDKVEKYMITDLHIERDGVGEVVLKEIKDELARRNISYCKVTAKHAPHSLSKTDKIRGCSDYIKDNFVFLAKNSELVDSDFVMSDEYKAALDETTTFTTVGKNLHDDAPDSLAQLSMVFKPLYENGSIEIPAFNPFRGGYGAGYWGN